MRILAFPRQDTVTGNPYLALLYRHMEIHGAQVMEFSFTRAIFFPVDVVHLHWPESHLGSRSVVKALIKHARLATVLGWMRLRGVRIVWTMHNLKPHDGDVAISRWLFELWFLRMVTHAIALTKAGRDLAFDRYPLLKRKSVHIVPHGHYRPIYPKIVPSMIARKHLALPVGADAFVFGFFGSIRTYKQTVLLASEFSKLRDPKTWLLIAGLPFTREIESQLRVIAADNPRIILRLGLVPDKDIPAVLGAMDMVVLPFCDILNSGSTLLALSCNRPVLAPNIGSLVDIQQQVGSEWLNLYDGLFTSATLAAAHTGHLGAKRASVADLTNFNWEGIAQRTLAVLADTEIQSTNVNSDPRPHGAASPQPIASDTTSQPVRRGYSFMNLNS